MKRVLIITYYWPPAGGGGVMRWLKMAKYLPEYGWQPVIYTPENPDPSVIDESLLAEVPAEAEVISTPIWEPYDLFRKLTGKSKESRFKSGYISEASRGSLKERVAVFIRGNLLIPDPRVFWVKPSVRFLRKYLAEHPVDLIISTGPPHSMHLIALKLKRYVKVPWLADFRDPWTGIDFYHRLKLTGLADRMHHRLEKRVLTSAGVVTVVSPGMKRSLEALAGREVHVVYNGFDPADFEGPCHPAELAENESSRFIISHFGAFNRDRNPSALWTALERLVSEIPTFGEKLKIRLIGQTDETILREIRGRGLGEQLEVLPHLEHREGLRLLGNSAVLLLPLNDSPNAMEILPGKMYEYMALGRPILAIGPEDSDCQEILTRAGAGSYHPFGDVEGIKSALEKEFRRWQKGEAAEPPKEIEKFSRRYLAGEIIRIGTAIQS
jgi:glycosyltransferase involved in cell wall biosynthesis